MTCLRIFAGRLLLRRDRMPDCPLIKSTASKKSATATAEWRRWMWSAPRSHSTQSDSPHSSASGERHGLGRTDAIVTSNGDTLRVALSADGGGATGSPTSRRAICERSTERSTPRQRPGNALARPGYGVLLGLLLLTTSARSLESEISAPRPQSAVSAFRPRPPPRYAFPSFSDRPLPSFADHGRAKMSSSPAVILESIHSRMARGASTRHRPLGGRRRRRQPQGEGQWHARGRRARVMARARARGGQCGVEALYGR